LNRFFNLRWEERNCALQQEFLRVKQEMNARGILNSSITIQNAHGVLVAEFEANRNLISKTILDHIRNLHRIADYAKFEGYAQKQLTKRKEYLERALELEFTNVLNGLQNTTMAAPVRSLDDQYELAQRELTIELNSVIGTYNRTFGNNLTEQLKNRFLNNPILAVVVSSVAGVAFIIEVLRLIGVVSFG
jgi:hypothetical protein